MKLERPFYRLPVRFDPAQLQEEISRLPDDAWVPHPQGFKGNDYVPLVTPSGRITNGFAGPMAATPHLTACPHLSRVMATLDCVWGRSRLMGLVPEATVPPHVDTNYYWRTHIRLHIPIVTNPDVRFTCGDTTVHMAEGEAWVFDTFQFHNVENGGDAKRIHLVADTVGGERLWDMVQYAKEHEGAEPTLVEPAALGNGPLRFERVNFPVVMSPWEVRCLVGDLLSKAVPSDGLAAMERRIERFTDAWSAEWIEHEDDAEKVATYRRLVQSAVQDLQAIEQRFGAVMLRNGLPIMQVLSKALFENAVENEFVRRMKAEAATAGPAPVRAAN